MTDDPPPSASPRFRTTRWSLVVDASGEPDSNAALDELCASYWYPLYAFARRSGHAAADAQDLVQGFFAALIEKDYLADADPTRGRFRTFLLTAFRNFASKARDRARAQKRGGDRVRLSLDFEDGERRYRLEPEDDRTPEAVFERRWALTLLDRAMERLARRHRGGSPEKAERFEALKPLLVGGPRLPYAEIGERLGMTETAIKVAAHRLRQSYGDCLRAEIAETVTDPALIDDEIARLVEAVRS